MLDADTNVSCSLSLIFHIRASILFELLVISYWRIYCANKAKFIKDLLINDAYLDLLEKTLTFPQPPKNKPRFC